ncbi:diacylglycerol/lipid kinase family protein [Nannocystis pusilla]|uniref:diacylglycerol/lipid kinase family protein n=1 Tax=Nannocystis pusilla TaxID=889268 RepID=UPI003B785515
MRARAIVNPNSSRGRLARAWPEVHARLEAALGPVEVAFTDAPMAAARLTREALRDGVELVIACGGDGTNNEVVNGFFEPPVPGGPDVRVGEGAALSILMLGTGGDFRKTFGAAGEVDAQVRRIAEGSPGRSTSAASTTSPTTARRRPATSSTSPASACPGWSTARSTRRGSPSCSAARSPTSRRPCAACCATARPRW